jgi:hypothetical protein
MAMLREQIIAALLKAPWEWEPSVKKLGMAAILSWWLMFAPSDHRGGLYGDAPLSQWEAEEQFNTLADCLNFAQYLAQELSSYDRTFRQKYESCVTSNDPRLSPNQRPPEDEDQDQDGSNYHQPSHQISARGRRRTRDYRRTRSNETRHTHKRRRVARSEASN